MGELNYRSYVSSDPEICHGQPCFKGTRIMVSIVLEMLAHGSAEKEIFKAYPSLPKKAVPAALCFAAHSLDVTRYHFVKYS